MTGAAYEPENMNSFARCSDARHYLAELRLTHNDLAATNNIPSRAIVDAQCVVAQTAYLELNCFTRHDPLLKDSSTSISQVATPVKP